MKKTYLIVIIVLTLLLSQAAVAATVNIDLSTTHQTIRGFGGMNFPRWIGTLTNAQVDTAFGNSSGQIGLTIMRIDVPYDSNVWSGELSAAQRAVNNHGAIVFASPWSPPAWMKTNNDVENGGELKTDAYDDYADHLSDFADYMSSNGVSLYAISLQNEPDVSVTYESCDWTSTQMRNFLINNASVIPTSVMVAESYHFDHSFTDPILNDSSAEAQLEIIAGHIYGGGLSDYPLARSKGKEVWMTEHYTDSSNDADLWPNALNVGKEIHDCMAANMNAYIWWYIRRFYGPIAEDGHITKRGYCMSHFAKFVRPGYVRVDATASPSSGVYITAYTSGDTLVIVAVNQNSYSSDVTFSVSGGSVGSFTKYETSSSNSLNNMGSVGSTDTLAANSINTYVGTIGGTPDATPPDPDPMTWASFPTATGSSTITMTATTATDANSPPVRYYFECTNDGSKSSGWQSSSIYVASGLTPNTQYSFRVKARDSYITPNETGWSSTQSATTLPPGTDVEILGGWLTGTSHTAEVNGANRLLVFVAHEESTSGDPALTSVTYGGRAMTKVIERSAVATGSYGNYIAAFILNDADITAATSSTFTPTWNAATSSVSYASVFLANVSQATSTGASSSNSTTSGTDPISTSSSLATNSGDMVIGAATCGNLGTYTMELNGFSEGTDQQAGSSGHTGATSYKSATGASETPSADFDGSVNRQVIIGFVVLAGAAVDLPPAAPTGLTATAGNETISLDWNDNTEGDLDGYNVYRSTAQGGGYGKLNVSLVTDSDYIDDTVTKGIPYYYVVTAVDFNGHESAYSNEATAATWYQTCAELQAGGHGLAADLDGNCYVNYWDLNIMVDNWLRTDCTEPDNCEGADFEPTDGFVDLFDFGDFALQWLWCNNPEDATCIPNWP